MSRASSKGWYYSKLLTNSLRRIELEKMQELSKLEDPARILETEAEKEIWTALSADQEAISVEKGIMEVYQFSYSLLAFFP